MHGDDGGLVRVEVDKAIAGRLASELVGHDLGGGGWWEARRRRWWWEARRGEKIDDKDEMKG